MPRLFIAIDLPERQHQDIEAIYRGLPTETRWTALTQLHLTLRFIGAVEEPLFQQIRETLAGLHFRPFPLQIEGLGVFPLRRRPNILWIGVADNHNLVQLHEGIERRLVQLGLTPEKRRFHPHLTIARLPLRISPEVLADYLDRNSHITPAPFMVDNFRLYSSLLTGNGAIHRIEESFAAG